MAPTPTSEAAPTSTPAPSSSNFKLATIVSIVIFSLFVLVVIASIILYVLHHKKQKAKLPPSLRTSSYRPFRSWSSKPKADQLLPNAAPVSESEDKSTMFSRDRSSSSVTLPVYVPEEHEYRSPSMESHSLIPFHITPADNEMANPMNRTTTISSHGSGSLYTRATNESPISALNPDGPIQYGSRLSQEMGATPNRPRSTSNTSVRYYEANSVPRPDEPAPIAQRQATR